MKNIFSVKLFVPLISSILVIGSLVTAGYYYQKYQAVKKNPEVISKEEVKSVTTAIRRFMDLPSDEDPTLATVTDQAKLKSQDFFKNAKNGDKLLIYTKSRKAILYRPSTDRIIEFAPLNIGDQPQATAAGVQTQPVKIAIYNGTKIIGLSQDYEKKLSGIAGISVTNKSNAAKNDYTTTSVYDLTGKNAALVSQIATSLDGSVGDTLPDGETKPQADILIIAGK